MNHKLLTIGGSLFGGTERWSIGIRFANSFDPTTGVDQAEVDACQAPIRTWFSSATTSFPTFHQVDMIKLAPIGIDGKYPGTLEAKEAVIATPIQGAVSAGSYPGQISLVVSLTTPFSRGRAHIGRVYPPPLSTSVSMAATGVLSAAQATSYMATFKTMMNGIRATPGLTAPAVMSRIGTGISIGITGLRVGCVLDTQRRRRSSLAENYQTVLL
jgi:hypothetical protein